MSIPDNPSLPEAQMPKNPQEKKLRRLVFVWLAAPAVCPWTCQDKRHTAIKKKDKRHKWKLLYYTNNE